MSPFKIEKGIPLPETTQRTGHNIQLLNDMQPGDSVYIADAERAARFYRVAKKLGILIAIRREGKGARMWRLKDMPPPNVPNGAEAKARAGKVIEMAKNKARVAKKGKAHA